MIEVQYCDTDPQIKSNGLRLDAARKKKNHPKYDLSSLLR